AARVFGGGLTGSLALDTVIRVLVALALGAPLAAFATAKVRSRSPLVTHVLVFVAVVVTAAGVAVVTGLFGDPAAVGVAVASLAAAVLVRVPPDARNGMARVLVLLIVGWLGGAVGLTLIDPAATMRVQALLGAGLDPDRTDALAVGGVTAGLQG